jgi:beta-lactamase regulating signal transducer with metallopeptidase domain
MPVELDWNDKRLIRNLLPAAFTHRDVEKACDAMLAKHGAQERRRVARALLAEWKAAGRLERIDKKYQFKSFAPAK